MSEQQNGNGGGLPPIPGPGPAPSPEQVRPGQLMHQCGEVSPGVMRFVLVSPPIAVQFDLPAEAMRKICADTVAACDQAGGRVKVASALLGPNGRRLV